MELLIYFLIPLGLTIVIEGIISLLCGIRSLRDIIVIILAQILTNPVVNYGATIVHQSLNATYYGLYLFIVETLVLLVESFVYKKCLSTHKISPFRLSAICNLSSFGVGVIWGLLG